MRYFSFTLSLLFIANGLGGVAFPQLIKQKEKREKSAQTKHGVIEGRCKDWQEIKLEDFSVCAPKSLKRFGGKCYDFKCDKFRGGDLILSIDDDVGARTPTSQIGSPSYTEKYFEIGGASAWMWLYEQEPPLKYISGVRFYFTKEKGKALTISVASTSKPLNEIAERIFKSVVFK